MITAYVIIAGGFGMTFLSNYLKPLNLIQATGLLWIGIGWVGVAIIEELRKKKGGNDAA